MCVRKVHFLIKHMGWDNSEHEPEPAGLAFRTPRRSILSAMVSFALEGCSKDLQGTQDNGPYLEKWLLWPSLFDTLEVRAAGLPARRPEIPKAYSARQTEFRGSHRKAGPTKAHIGFHVPGARCHVRSSRSVTAPNSVLRLPHNGLPKTGTGNSNTKQQSQNALVPGITRNFKKGNRS